MNKGELYKETLRAATRPRTVASELITLRQHNQDWKSMEEQLLEKAAEDKEKTIKALLEGSKLSCEIGWGCPNFDKSNQAEARVQTLLGIEEDLKNQLKELEAKLAESEWQNKVFRKFIDEDENQIKEARRILSSVVGELNAFGDSWGVPTIADVAKSVVDAVKNGESDE